MKMYILRNSKLKKRYIALILFIILFILCVGFLRNSINSENNQIYIERLIKKDICLNEKYGYITSYWVKKVGRNFGPIAGESSEIKYYDKYDIYVNGEKSNSLITIRLYKNKQSDIVKSTVAIDGKVRECDPVNNSV